MKGKKRFISKCLKMPLFIIFIVAVIILSNVIFNHMQSEQDIINSYEERKQKCELLKEIKNETIQEGICIDTRKISNDEIQYDICNDNESIIYYYYLQDDSTTDPEYNATITLSKDYKILKEEYSTEIESFDEYFKNCNLGDRYLSIYFAVCIVLAFCLLIWIFKKIISLKKYVHIKKKELGNTKKQNCIDTISGLGQSHYLVHGWKKMSIY